MTDITYNNIKTRASDMARELLPALPKLSTTGAWEAYAEDLESFDIYEAAHMEADSWDVVIYHYKAMALCNDVPTSVLHEAEAQWEDSGDGTTSGLYELASTLAYWIVQRELADAMESAQSDLSELAQNQIDNLESVG